MKKLGNKPIPIDGIHLWEDGNYVYVEVDIGGNWYKVIRERKLSDGSFSHIIEPDGIRLCVKDSVTF